MVKLHGLRVYVWSTIDVDSGEILAIYASWSRSIMVTMKFIRMILDRCLNKPLIIVDRGPWYLYALNRLGILVYSKKVKVSEPTRLEAYARVHDVSIVFVDKDGGEGLHRLHIHGSSG